MCIRDRLEARLTSQGKTAAQTSLSIEEVQVRSGHRPAENADCESVDPLRDASNALMPPFKMVDLQNEPMQLGAPLQAAPTLEHLIEPEAGKVCKETSRDAWPAKRGLTEII